MTSLDLEYQDIQEVLSSLILANMPYKQRLALMKGSSLPDDFLLGNETVANFNVVISQVMAVFHEATPPAAGITLQAWAKVLAKNWQASTKEITFFTSGSTGMPVPATHPISYHEQEVTALARLFSDRKRIMGFVPRHHIYGFLFSVLLPKALAIEVEWHQPMPTLGLKKILRSGDLVIGFPLFWEKLAKLGVHIPQGTHGVTSTGPCAARIIQALQSNGLTRMTEMYGSSETGGIGYRDTPGSSYKLLPYWQRTQKDFSLTRTFTNGETKEFPLQDTLQWETKSLFIPVGRADKAVQVAGVNVYPKRVKEIIEHHPKVKECVVRLMRPDEGYRLKALVVPSPKTNVAQLERELRLIAKENLSQYERPSSWTFSEALPTNSMGKLADW